MKVNKRAEIIVEGIVQGVGFRYFVYKYAKTLGLTGWTKNHYDGTVHVLAEGDEDLIQQLVDNLKIGPMRSVVQKVKVVFSDYSNEFNNFDIK
ncbi:MAG: acylphosphatase [FCB group bacterium]|jgi:acylphosphatase